MVDAFDYLESRDDADGLIEEFGTTAALRRIVNTGTAWEPSQSASDFTTLAVQLDLTNAQRADSDVLVTDERWLIAAGPLNALGVTTISLNDTLVVGGSAVGRIVQAKPLKPAGTVVLFDCVVRF